MTEYEEFEQAVKNYRECSSERCACTGSCLGTALARLRKKYDHQHDGSERWWSDQGHCSLKRRPGDSGRTGAPLNAANYWFGAQ